MSRHDDLTSLRAMRDHAREAIELATTGGAGEIITERLLSLALTRLIEIVGEASTRVSPDVQALAPKIPWHLIRGMRNRLIHGYDRVDEDRLWRTMREDLPPLVEQIDDLVSRLEVEPGA